MYEASMQGFSNDSKEPGATKSTETQSGDTKFRFFFDKPILQSNENILWRDSGTDDEGFLWSEGKTIVAQMQDIAEAIIEPLLQGDNVGSSPQVTLDTSNSAGSLTFAVHGPWGSGKTSFIRMAINLAKEKLTAHRKLDRFIETWYNASMYEGAKLSPRATLARNVLLALANDDRERAIILFSERVDNIGVKISEKLNNQKSHMTPIEWANYVNSELERISERLSDVVGFDRLLEAELLGKPEGLSPAEQQKVMVVVIDDLDRCSPEFSAAMLEVIQQWSNVNNLFFVLAVAREVLNEVIAQRYKWPELDTRTEVALEKYVQHSVEIPELPSPILASYIRNILQAYTDPVSHLLRDGAELIAAGMRVRTPRAVRKCLNTIRPALRNINLAAHSQDELFRQIKEQVLEYSWRDFYRNFFLRARNKQNQFTYALAALEKASYEYSQEEDREQLEFDFGRVRARLKVDEDDLPHDDLLLIQFMAQQPWFVLNESMLVLSTQTLLSGIIPASDPEKAVPMAGFVPRKTPIEQLEDLSRQGRLARIRYDYQAMLEASVKGRALFQEHGLEAFTQNEVADFGNLALYAEHLVEQTRNPEIQRLAFDLFSIAYQLNRHHIPTNLAFISFLLDAQQPPLRQHYDFCNQVLLEQEEEMRGVDLERWLLLKAQLAYSAPDLGLSWEEPIAKLAELVEQQTDNVRPFERLVSFYRKAVDVDRVYLKRAAQFQIPALSGDAHNQALLIYADNLDKRFAQSPETDLYESLEIYRYILRPIEEGGLVDEVSLPRRMNAYHNYAVNLLKAEYKQEAGRAWFEAYKVARDRRDAAGSNAVRSYLLYLIDECDRADLAGKVEQREPIDEMALAKSGKPIPGEFVPGGMRALFPNDPAFA